MNNVFLNSLPLSLKTNLELPNLENTSLMYASATESAVLSGRAEMMMNPEKIHCETRMYLFFLEDTGRGPTKSKDRNSKG